MKTCLGMTLLVLFGVAVGSSSARAQTAAGAPKAAAWDPVREIYEINEAARRDAIARQIDLKNRMIWLSGYGPRASWPFEPWPRVPGDIWGYPQPRPIPQPIGHESAQTAPNRWTYRPVYRLPLSNEAGESQPGMFFHDRPPLGVALPAPAEEVQSPRPLPAAPRPSGPRAF